MSKKEKQSFQKSSSSLPEQSDLKKSAVDRLVEAQHGDASGVDETTMKEDRKSLKIIDSIPAWIKALFVKWWFVGAACFFFLWGLGTYISGTWDMILVFGLATGAVNDLLTNNCLRLLETEENQYSFYTMFYSKKLWALFVNILYALFITLLVVYTYNGMNSLIIKLNPDKYEVTDVPVAVGPLLYSLFYLVYDMIFVMVKNLYIYITKKLMGKSRGGLGI